MAKCIWRRFPDDYLQEGEGWLDLGMAGQALVADRRGLAAPVVEATFFEVPEPPPPVSDNITRMLLGFVG
jgi:hypothetical protein